MIPYGRQLISDEDVEAVLTVLRSDFLTQGPIIGVFEEKVARTVQAQHALALSNATASLHAACYALGLKEGDRLWTSPNSFVASANCARYCGATVDFVDIDPTTYNMCPVKLRTKLEAASQTDTLPRIVVPVHFSGAPCDIRAIHNLSQEFGFRIIEDASHAIGATYENRPVGSCEYSDITVFSFHPVKIITTGEGGVVTTNSAELAEKVSLFRSHGVSRDQMLFSNEDEGAWYYEQLDLGYNYRMTEIQAALGNSQLNELDSFIKRRKELVRVYDEQLNDLPVLLPEHPIDAESSHHLYVVQILEEANKSRRQVFDFLRGSGILVNVHYIPIHLQPYYRDLGFTIGDFPVSEKYYQSALSLPLHPSLKDSEQSFVIEKLGEILK